MLASVRWLNTLLAPGSPGSSGPAGAVTPDEAEHVLTFAGFPIESREDLPGGDVRLDVEVTSNRGDCLSHLGLAREIAAATGRQLIVPTPDPEPDGEPVGSFASLQNTTPDVCPRFTARVIRGVKVGPSPRWLVEALEAVGQRSINNVVDVSNYVLLELGNPSHTFDLNTLAGRTAVIRWAKKGERFEALDGRTHTLREDELVVADAERAVSLAGVIGGESSSVTERTTDVLLEVATWDPATIRRAARRLNIRTDAGHRFERIVDARTIDAAADRLAALILELAGGSLAEGVLDAGAPAVALRIVEMRAQRCRDLLGVDTPTTEMARLLTALDVDAHLDEPSDTLRCEIPPHRPDLTREVDLIEEVARTHGYDRIPMHETVQVRVAPPQADERAMREIADTLTGCGFFETVTFSFITPEEAALFLPAGMRVLRVDEERRKGEPALRPSVLPSLLRCRRINQDAGLRAEGGVRLFEFGGGYAEDDEGQTVESRNLALLIDAPDEQQGLRAMRGVLDAIGARVGGMAPVYEAHEGSRPADRPDATIGVSMGGVTIGAVRLFSNDILKRYGIEGVVVGAEVDLPALISVYPPRPVVRALAAFPAIERDLSVIVDEATTWASIEGVVKATGPALLEHASFVGVYRGKQVGAGKKSVTLRLRFRDPARTLRHEEVDPQVAAVVAAMQRDVDAALRA